MLQCSECEYFVQGPDGKIGFQCDPFRTIKEPECLDKWNLLRLAEMSGKLDRIVTAYETTADMYKRLAPLQEKMFRHMEREIDEAEDAEAWKRGPDDLDDDDDDPLMLDDDDRRRALDDDDDDEDGPPPRR